MSAKKAAKKRGPRPATRALQLLKKLGWQEVDEDSFYVIGNTDYNELWKLLETMDASTGKPDAARKRRKARKR